jgi:hypothetical protein
MILFLNIVTTVCIGLLIGTEFSVSAFINPILNKLDDHAQAQATRLFGKRLGGAMPYWYCASLLLMIVGAIAHRFEPGDLLMMIACAL